MKTGMQNSLKLKRWVGLVVSVFLLVFAAVNSARWLVVDDRQKADVIVVLAGETDVRPALGLELLRGGYGSRLVLDVPAGGKIYRWTQVDLAQNYIQTLPESKLISICPIRGLSTKDEAVEAGKCIDGTGGRKVLIVTSDYHTRRALSIFRTLVTGHEFCVAAAHEPEEFGRKWWRHREWAKTNFYEWLRLSWWELIDRWR
ncbi:MAG TPA: YdcF family protein [Terriglobales bacterium]|nr:YdcF family protein [Terriglobales bacterium]